MLRNFTLPILSIIIMSGCGERRDQIKKNEAVPFEKVDINPSTSTVKLENQSQFYLHLTAVSLRDGRGSVLGDVDRQLLTLGCIEQYGFSIDRPVGEVKNARSIELPLDTYLYEPEVEIEVSDQSIGPPKVIDGVVFDGEATTRVVRKTKKLLGKRRILGNCFGTEYIL